MHGTDESHTIVLARGLKKLFGDLRAVDDVSFTVDKGECFGLLGPNGAGKTTTVLMLYGFYPPTDGTLTIFGLDAKTNLRSIKERIGVCQQENNLDPDLDSLTNLEVFARYFNIPKHERKQRAQDLLRFVSLEHKAKAKVTELSGGMKRRLLLARSLINNPDLLILDEPTTGLDPQTRHLTWELLRGLKRQGKGILLTTHYMEEASQLCDRLVIMDQGRILVEGKPSELIEEIIGSNVMEAFAPPDDFVEHARRWNLKVDVLPQRLIVYGPKVKDFFRGIGADCQGGCMIRMATLEDVFLKLTGRELRE